MNNILRYSDIDNFLKLYSDSKNGCLIDTNTLIAWAFGAHEFADDAEFIFDRLAELSIPVFCNVNIRAEFLEFARRLLITEGLLSIYDQSKERNVDATLKVELGRLRASQKKKEKNDLLYTMNDSQIKRLRKIINNLNDEAWSDFCKEFLIGALENEWERILAKIQLNFLEVRESDTTPTIPTPVTWPSLVKLMEKTGSASNDAMVLNIFEKSKPIFLITTDADFAYNLELASINKFIFLPQNHSYWN